MDLDVAEDLAWDLMLDYGLLNPNRDGGRYQFGWDRGRVRFGCCHWDTRRITLSRVLVALNPLEDVEDTIRHEIAHALTGPTTPGHGAEWRLAARLVGAIPSAHALVAQNAPKRWIGFCLAECRPDLRPVQRHRRMLRARCRHCHAQWVWEENPEWTP